MAAAKFGFVTPVPAARLLVGFGVAVVEGRGMLVLGLLARPSAPPLPQPQFVQLDGDQPHPPLRQPVEETRALKHSTPTSDQRDSEILMTNILVQNTRFLAGGILKIVAGPVLVVGPVPRARIPCERTSYLQVSARLAGKFDTIRKLYAKGLPDEGEAADFALHRMGAGS